MVKTFEKMKENGSEVNSSSLKANIDRLRTDLINCPDYDTWDAVDQKKINSDLVLQSFLETNFTYKRVFQSACKCASWKVENKINSLRAETFPKEMHSNSFVYIIPADVNGIPTLLLRLCFPSPPRCLLPYIYQYFYWNLEKILTTSLMTSRKPRLVIDFTDPVIDLFLLKQILYVLVCIYPPWVESITLCNMHWKYSLPAAIFKKLLPSSLNGLIVTTDRSIADSLGVDSQDLPAYLGGSTFNCSYDEWINCPDLSDFLKSKGLNEKQINESMNFKDSVIKKWGYYYPRKH